VVASTGPGHAVELAREAYEQGYRRFIAVGGDGTPTKSSTAFMNAHEAKSASLSASCLLERAIRSSAILRKRARNASLQALIEGRTRAVDLVRLTHAEGEVYSFNLLSLGFTADVGALTNRYFKPFGYLGYLLGVFVRVVQLRRRAFRLELRR